MHEIPEAPYDEAAEARLRRQIEDLNSALQKTLSQLAHAKAELEIRQRIAVGRLPAYIRPRKLSLTQVALDVLRHNSPRGVKFSELVKELQRAGYDVRRTSLSTILDRLRRDRCIVRDDSRWRIAKQADVEGDE